MLHSFYINNLPLKGVGMLDLSLSLMITTAIVFLILLKYLSGSLYGPLLTFMANREKSIADDLANANANSSDVEGYKAQAKAIISEAKQEASKIRETAINQAKSVASEETEKQQGEFEKEYESFIAKLSESKVEIKNSLMANLPLYKEGVKIKLSQL